MQPLLMTNNFCVNSEGGRREEVKAFVFCRLHHTPEYLLGIYLWRHTSMNVKD